MRKIWRAITSVPMRDEGFAFTDVVSGKSVRSYVDRHGRRWLCTNRWGIGRVLHPMTPRIAMILGGDEHGELIQLKDTLADGDRCYRQHPNREAVGYTVRKVEMPIGAAWVHGWVLLHDGHLTKSPEIWFRNTVREHLTVRGRVGGEP